MNVLVLTFPRNTDCVGYAMPCFEHLSL